MSNYKLKEILKIRNGRDHQELEDGKFPVYGSGGIMRFVNQYLYDKPSILLPRKGTLDNIQFCDTPFWTVDTTYYTEINEVLVNPYFLYRYLRLLDLSNLSSGTGVPSMTFDSYYDIKVDLPEKSAQDAIASVLSSLDRKISLNRKANELLESMAKQLYDYWFVQFDFPNAEGKPYKSSGGKMVYNEKLKREIPEGWEVKQLAELTKDEMESICPCDTPDVMFKHYSIPAFDDCASYALEKGDTILSNKFVPTENDILVSKLNPWTSRVIWCTDEENAICSTEFVSLAPDNHEEKGFFYMLAKSKPFIIYCTKASTGTSHSHRRVNPEIMKMFIFPYQKDIISAYSKIVSNYIEKSVKHIHENKKLQSLRDYLLPLLMNGQVKVS